MISMTFECPTTHEPLPTVSPVVWTADGAEVRVVMHCPRCSGRHEFSRANAILAFAAPAEHRNGALTLMH